MSLFFPKTITAFGKLGARINGVWQDTPQDPFTFAGSVQPLSAREYSSLPSGREDIGMMKIYTEYALKVSKAGGDTPGDTIEWQGKYWAVTSISDNQNGLISHKKYFAEYAGEVTT